MSYRDDYRGRPYDRYWYGQNYNNRSSYGSYRPAYDSDNRGYRSGTQNTYSRFATSSSSSTSQNASHYHALEENELRSHHKDDTKKYARSETDREDIDGIKKKDLGYAFIGSEKEKYIKEQLRSQIGVDGGNVSQSDTLAENSSSLRLTPRHIVEECKRSGHFDNLRKQILRDFQKSSLKEPFMEKLEAYLLERIEKLEPKKKENLARQEDKRLQNSELTRWIEEGKSSAKVFDDLFSQIRGNNGKEDQIGLFEEQDGRLDKDLRGRLQDVIAAERGRIQNANQEGDSDDDEGGGSDSTPMFKSSATPLGRETPKEVRSNGSFGDRTPLPPG